MEVMLPYTFSRLSVKINSISYGVTIHRWNLCYWENARVILAQYWCVIQIFIPLTRI